MHKLIEIRNQEKMCREHAQWDLGRRVFWLAKTEEWKRCASNTGDITRTSSAIALNNRAY